MLLARHFSSTRLIRSFNAAAVLQTLYRHGSCSRSQLARLTGMSPATITRIVTELLEQGIVQEGRHGKSTGGRKPVYLHIDYSKLFIVSVQLLRDDSRVALIDLDGRILLKRKLSPSSLTPHGLLSEVTEMIETLLEESPINREHILGVGVAISGVVDSERGVMIKSVNLGWENVPVAQILNDALDLPVYVENDANASALAEFWFGHSRDTDSSMYIKTETGAGIGIILGKTLVSGPHWMAGEIGHVPLIPNGHACRCGQKGCLETYVYINDVLDRYWKQTERGINKQQFVQLAKRQDHTAKQLLNETAEVLSKAVCLWGILLDLDVIIIGGFWGQFDKEIIERIRQQYLHILEKTGIHRDITITSSSLGEDNDLLGAAGLVIHRWFTPLELPLNG